ncbi:MAG: hypothetical protein MMC33_008879 [Icmadophila ericetorum]|nr:hypothetical protein [Icmadophila ericetorum]
MADIEKSSRVHWGATDEEAAKNTRPTVQLSRSNSKSSQMSIHNMPNRRTSVDPGKALPIQYRTVSYDIDESTREDFSKAQKVQKAKDSAVKELSSLDWHILSGEEVLRRLSTSIKDGLSEDQVKRRVTEYGRNVPTPPKTHYFKTIMGYCFKGFGSILLLGSILVFISWKPLGEPPSQANLALAIVLLAVFLIQAAFNAWQDWSSSRVMASITTLLSESCLIMRESSQITVASSEVVPGDIVFIKAGNKLPADCRFVEVSSDAKFDRSILTGESAPLSGTSESTDTNYLETKCIGLQGTHCVSGSATGVVVATGDRTVFGRIAKLTNEPKTGMTTLERELLRFVIIICSIMFSMIILVIVLWASWLRTAHPNWINVPTLIVDCVSVAIAFIPEGLPIALAASLTITANLMRKNNVLCKSLKTVETLGAVSVICTDKTGTLTKNKMYVTEYSIADRKFTSSLASEGPSGNAIQQLRTVAGMCNSGDFDASTINSSLPERKINGDATDQAILRFSESIGAVSELRQLWKKEFELAFNSKNKFMIRMLSLSDPDGLTFALSPKEAATFEPGHTLLTIKGAPDMLIGRCTHFINNDGDTDTLDRSKRAVIEDIKNQWSSQGKRVILLARRVISKEQLQSSPSSNSFEVEVMDLARSGLTIVGMVGIVDPPRDEIPEVMRILRGAGIRIFMVTGDFALTAEAIARECGIITNDSSMIQTISNLHRGESRSITKGKENGHPLYEGAPPTSIVLSGPELITLNDIQWEQLCQYDEIVFARTTPEQKLRIVREFQAREKIVGMTGDGVNDAPSLKAADIGIALGSGSDIAIEAADMVLLDSFSAIVEAVKYGRMVFDNLKKTVAYLLPAGSFSEFWPVMTNILFGLPQVLSSFLMIIICCFTDCFAATVLAYEKPEADVLLRKPRDPRTDRLVDWQLMLQAYGFVGIIETLSSFAMAYWYLQRNGITFSDLWFQYGNTPAGLDPTFIAARLNEASSIYFVNLVVMQWFNLMAVRTRRLSIFSHPPAFNPETQNLYLFPAILFALAMAVFWLYIPQLQSALGTSMVPAQQFFLPATFGFGVLILDEARKAGVRRWPEGLLAKCAW